MPPKKNPASDDEGTVPSFTENEALFVKAIFDCMNSRPDVDFNKVATTMGLANAKSARDKFRVISKKHGWSSTDGSGGAASNQAKGALGVKNATKVKKAPVKKKGTAQRKKNTKKQESSESDNDEDVSAKLESDSDGQKAAKDELMENSSNSD
ncbi:uncharacterized protein ColSpa_07165 [Colletotrichum spaethianum]|uniref:Uncharacterized protein n=1 Tax=Colletotrichum spaethianum TaxID=700344 RepID=A0AA37P828_9PEZI|nr:uncharacterized protein ColSpa_07165 [Colletotrichum spaethianum]GKT46984.1 hypothetical protein ColSpa_07165 [Colletotrichum spaethianum]